jgi:hypothetical protein
MSTRRWLTLPILAGSLGVTAFLAASPPRPDEDVKELARERLKIAQREVRQIEEGLTQPPAVAAPTPVPGIDDLVDWSLRWAESELDLADSDEARIAALQGHRERVEKWQEPIRLMAEGAGSRTGPRDIARIDYAVLEARTAVMKLRRE